MCRDQHGRQGSEAGTIGLKVAQRGAIGQLKLLERRDPAALVGMALVLRDWGLVKSGVFTLLLQIAGINLSGALAFRIFGVRPAAGLDVSSSAAEGTMFTLRLPNASEHVRKAPGSNAAAAAQSGSIA